MAEGGQVNGANGIAPNVGTLEDRFATLERVVAQMAETVTHLVDNVAVISNTAVASAVKREDVGTTDRITAIERNLTHLSDNVANLAHSVKAVMSNKPKAAQTGATGGAAAGRGYLDGTRPKTTWHSPPLRQSEWEQEHDDSECDDRMSSYTSLADDDRTREQHAPKLPMFCAKESWTVWFNRFSDVADQYSWGHARRLRELLPRMGGDAGEFVYNQLSRETRRDYATLIAELNNRFRVVETRKSFAVKFNKLAQLPGQSPEEFAAELKRLYDKGYKLRDPETRRESLLRRYLDGLRNRDISFQVEFVKDPSTIEDAVVQTVLLQETKTYASQAPEADKRRPPVRASRCDTLQQDSIGDEKFNSDIAEMKCQLEKLCGILTDMASRQTPRRLYPSDGGQKQTRLCFGCGGAGHFIRDCPTKQNNSGPASHSPRERSKQQTGPNSTGLTPPLTPRGTSKPPTGNSSRSRPMVGGEGGQAGERVKAATTTKPHPRRRSPPARSQEPTTPVSNSEGEN
jgi:hypothetical protein